MSKYDPLARFLRRQRSDEVSLTFRDVERIIRGVLPKASQTQEWWADDGNTLQGAAWRSSGFAIEASPKIEKLRFVRIRAGERVGSV